MANNRLLLECARCKATVSLARFSAGDDVWSPSRTPVDEYEAWLAEHSYCMRGLGLKVRLVGENTRFLDIVSLPDAHGDQAK